MKKTLKIFLYIIAMILFVFFILFWVGALFYQTRSFIYRNDGEEVKILTENGYSFRDLNKNGKLDVYEDSRYEVEDRVTDLIAQMNMEEKAGMMFFTMIGMGKEGDLHEIPDLSNPITLMLPSNSKMVISKKINHFNILNAESPIDIAIWNNNIQKLAEKTRLGIPITIGSDPRHAFNENLGANLVSKGFSKWCEPIGFAAIRDTVFLEKFASIAREEYVAVGIRLALHPMADLATEPRWGRINGTFGEDAELSSILLRAYIRGFQGTGTLDKNSVACMAKHFPGGGPQKNGLDAHFEYGKEQIYPGNNFDYHLIPFEKGVFPSQAAQIMPYYGVPVNQTSEEVAFAFNKEIITDLLRNKYHFQGVVCSDWGVLEDMKFLGKTLFASPGWGVETLSPKERAYKSLDAGIDQFGGAQIPEVIVSLVEEGKISEQRIDISVKRILRDKFKLGLFDNPFVDIEKVNEVVGKDEFIKIGEEAQRKSMILLKNDTDEKGSVLPLDKDIKVYTEGFDTEKVKRYAEPVSTIEKAELAILRIKTPYQPMGDSFLEGFFHQGDLDFKSPKKEYLLKIINQVPTILIIHLERPAVITELAEKCVGLLAEFGASDISVLEVLFGNASPMGRLPFELPSSMEEVREQKEDVPYDTPHPLFQFGYGLDYKTKENGK